MDYLIGIDGGGTKTLLRAVDHQKNILCEATSGGSNIYSLGQDMVERNLKQLFIDCFTKLPPDCCLKGICIGSAGVVGKENQETLRKILFDITSCSNIFIINDGIAALYAHLDSQAGVSITSGTGSICLGKDRKGNTARSGGWGHLFSDEGSAYAIACDSLRAVSAAMDGRGEKTILTDLFLSFFKTVDYEEMVHLIYHQYQSKKEIASLAMITAKAAEQKDNTAIRIIEKASDTLFQMCSAVIMRLSLDQSPIPVILNGSTLLKNDFLRSLFTKKIYHSFPMSSIMPASKDAAWGAISYLSEQMEEV